MARFDDCLQVILGNEGGVSNNAADHGGLTNYGVTQATYDQYRMSVAMPKQAVTAITLAEASSIYSTGYWVPSRCDRLHPALDLCVFDCAVNSGVNRAAKLLQAAVGAVQDGLVGNMTLAAISQVPVLVACEQYCDQREAFLRGIVAADASQAIFLNGWINRVNHIRHLAGVPGY